MWGADGQEYIVLTAAELSGMEEIMQPPPTMEAGMTEEPMMAATPMAGATEEMVSPTNPARSGSCRWPQWRNLVAKDWR